MRIGEIHSLCLQCIQSSAGTHVGLAIVLLSLTYSEEEMYFIEAVLDCFDTSAVRLSYREDNASRSHAAIGDQCLEEICRLSTDATRCAIQVLEIEGLHNHVTHSEIAPSCNMEPLEFWSSLAAENLPLTALSLVSQKLLRCQRVYHYQDLLKTIGASMASLWYKRKELKYQISPSSMTSS